MLRQGWARVVAFFRKRELDRDFDAELAAHMEMATEDHLRQGMSLTEARRLARIKLGGIEQSRELHRDSRGLPWLDGIIQDVRFACRSLGRSPGFALTAIITLALAIGANTAIFSAVDAALLHPLSFPQPNRLVLVTENMPAHNLRDISPSSPDFVYFREQQTCFSQIADIMIDNPTLTGNGAPEAVLSARVSASAYTMLGIVPILGSVFASDDEQLGDDHLVILSKPLWIRRYGADPSIVGTQSYRVVGVIPKTAFYQAVPDVLLPLALKPDEIALGRPAPHWRTVIGRLKPGWTLEQARQQFRAIGARLAAQYPEQVSGDRNFSVDLLPLAETQGGNLRTPLLVLIAAVGALMLIACANISNLLLARAMLRRKEISVRAALGAERSRVVRLLLTESLILAMIGGAMGTGLAFGALQVLRLYGPPGLLNTTTPSMNVWVITFSVAVSAGTSALFGLAPALAISRVDLAESLKELSRSATAGRHLLRESMVAAEIATSLILLTGTGLLVRSFVTLAHENRGYNPENVLHAGVFLPPTQYRDSQQRIAFARSLLERVRALPGVLSAGAADVPGGAVSAIKVPRNHDSPGQVVVQTRTSPDYFRTLDIPLRRGRDFFASDDASGAAIIDQNVARLFFPNQDPIGRLVTLPIPGLTVPVVGVVGAVKYNGDGALPPKFEIYYLGPSAPFPPVELYIKTRRDPLGLANAIRHEIATLDPDLPVRVETMEHHIGDSLARERFAISLMSSFAALAALLATIGIYSVLTYLADQRRREFGIRLALGARPGDVLAMVLKQGSIPVVFGLAAGFAGSLTLTRLIATLLYHVSPTDPATFASVFIGLIAIAFAAMIIPANRSAHVDPVETLRQE